MEYLHWKEERVDNETTEVVNKMYDNGFVFTRIDRGVMHQTRSIRIDLNKFELSSENRRILRKGENIILEKFSIPYSSYKWEIGKMAKDFYDKKADGAFSANRIKELITTSDNFNSLYSFSGLGYAICYENNSLLHYCYPFYDLEKSQKDMGLIMMTKVLEEAKTLGLKYVYLGSLQRPSDVYKLQFKGVEWFDGKVWKEDLIKVKNILSNS
jgi:arginyl-tRNA--protein-N-Asp/Glu arginylyltransferase